MNAFDRKLKESGQYPLVPYRLDTFVVNFGLKKNLRSMYYYSQALNDCTDEMSLKVMDRILEILQANRDISLVEITGASPETNPHFKYFVNSLSQMGIKLAVVSNPAIYSDPGMEDMPEFLAEHKVKILAFVPHYKEEVVDRYTGKGTFKKIVTSFKRLNRVGFSRHGSDLTTAFVYLPAEPVPAQERENLKKAFMESYKKEHGIDFNHFIVFNTIPIGRFKQDTYLTALKDNFNPSTLKNLPCRHAISTAADGKLYDCDFKVAAARPVRCASINLDNFDYELLKKREVSGSELCFICTAGEGATCAECFT